MRPSSLRHSGSIRQPCWERRSRCCAGGGPPAPGLLFGYASLDEGRIAEGIGILAEVVAQVRTQGRGQVVAKVSAENSAQVIAEGRIEEGKVRR